MRAREGSGTSGVFKVAFLEVAEETLKATDKHPEAFQVVFSVTGSDQKVSLGVPLQDPHPLGPFAKDPKADRAWISANVKGEHTVRVFNSYIQEVLAPAGTWIFTELVGIWAFARKSDGVRRLRFTIARADGAVTSWTCRDPELVCVKGETPEQDEIGMGESMELNQNATAFQHLISLGLDWDRFMVELNDEMKWPALWPGHLLLDGGEAKSFFSDQENPWKSFPAIVRQHGAKPVQVTVNDHEQYGLGPQRTGKFPIAELKTIVMAGAEKSTFDEEREYFLAIWDNVTKTVFNGDVRFTRPDGDLTDSGKEIAVSLIVPVIREWPDIVMGKNKDGTPLIAFPIEEHEWKEVGLTQLSIMAERLLKLDDIASVKPVEWCRENVPELSGEIAERTTL